MKAVVLSSPGTLNVEERSPRQPGPGEVSLRVKAAGIGGTDLRIFGGLISTKLPLVLGQEFSGIVEETDRSSRFKRGDQVAVEPVVRDGTCDFCRKGLYTLCGSLKVLGIHLDGGYAESVVVPEYTIHRLPNETSFEEGALVVPAAVAKYAVSRAGSLSGLTVAIIGAGPIGLCALQLARLEGASSMLVSEPLEARASLARDFGASQVTTPSPDKFSTAVSEATHGEGFDVVIEATGNPEAVDMALQAARRRGTVVFAGAFGKPAQVGVSNIVRKDLVVKGSWLYPNEYSKTLDLVKKGKVNLKGLVTRRFRFAEAGDAFAAARDPSTIKAVFVN